MTATGLRDETSLVYRFDAEVDGAFWLARQLCEQWLRARHVRCDAVGDLVLVVTELCTGLHGPVVLRAECADDGGVALTVESAGGVAVSPGPTGDLRLAAALCDEVALSVTPDRTVARARAHGVILPE